MSQRDWGASNTRAHSSDTSMLWFLLASFAITFACTKIIYSDCIHVNDEKIFSFVLRLRVVE